MNPIQAVEEWVATVALKKVVVRLAGLLASYGAAKGAVVGLNISVDPDKLTAAVYAGFELVRNWLKVKKGWTWL